MTELDISSQKIAVVGKGNVGTHLTEALSKHSKVVNIDSRSLQNFPGDCDIAIISVSDKAIEEVAQALKGRARVMAHTSGSVPMDVLEGCAPSFGVFYPMQTFTKGASMKYSDIPFFIEGNNNETTDFLSALASTVSDNVREADSRQRKRLHLASVFACNFSNHLVEIADEILREGGMDYSILLPLLRRTIEKLETVAPVEAQTGPAVREDYPVLKAHMEMLASSPSHQELYRLLSSDIINTKNLNS